jgi:hypothetical protein
MWKVVSIFLITVTLITGIVFAAGTLPNDPGFEIPGLLVHFFELTVSPAGICASIGEQIEIRCTVESLINTPVEISSAYVVLFNSHDNMIREQAMTEDSYWSFHTLYTIAGDEAYYKLRVNYTLPHGDAREHSEYGAYLFPIVVKT